MTLPRTFAPARAALAAPILVLGLAALPLCLPQAARAQGYTFETFDFPGADDTLAQGINNSGQIVGFFDINFNASGDYQRSGFSVSAAALGASGPSAGDFITYSVGLNSGFDGISDTGQIVGDYLDAGTSTTRGFLLSGAVRTDFSVPGDDPVSPGGVNSGGGVSGSVTDASAVSHGFLRSAAGVITLFDDPSADGQGTFAYGLNNAGDVAGEYTDAATGLLTPFIYHNGAFTALSGLSGVAAGASSINNAGDVAGFFETSDGAGGLNPPQGFLLTAGGTLITLDVPGAVSTIVQSVNDSDQAVGYYTDANGFQHGFLAFVPAPEPPAFAGFALGALGLAGLALRARRRA